MMGSCRELFGHFVLMSEVLSAVVSCKLPLNFAHSSSLYLFVFLPLWFSLLLFVHFDSSLCQIFFLWKFMCYHYPSFWSAISRSDPFDMNCYIFNPDLDNGTVSFLLLGYLLLWGCLCHSHFVSPIILTTLNNAELRYNRNYVYTISSNFNIWSFNLFHKLCSPYLSMESVIY